MNSTTSSQWISMADLCARTKRSPATIRRLMKSGLLPPPVTRGRWLEKAVDAALLGQHANDNDPVDDPWSVDADAINNLLDTAKRHHSQA